MSQVRDMPFYQLVNDLLGCLMKLQALQAIRKYGRKWSQAVLKSVDIALVAMQRSLI